MISNKKSRGKHAKTNQKAAGAEETKKNQTGDLGDKQSAGDADATKMLSPVRKTNQASSGSSNESKVDKAKGASESSDAKASGANSATKSKTEPKRGYKTATAGAVEEEDAKEDAKPASKPKADVKASGKDGSSQEKTDVSAEEEDGETPANPSMTVPLSKAKADEAQAGKPESVNVGSASERSISLPPNSAPYSAYPPPYGQGEASGFVAAGLGEIKLKRRRNGLKVFGIAMGVIVGALLLVYLVGAIVFMGRFLPSTSIGGKDVSMKTNEEVVSMLNDIVSDYRLDIVGGGFSYRLTGSDVGLSLDADGIVKDMHEDLNSWKWPVLILQPSHDETDQLVITSNKAAYEPGLKAEIEKYNETAKDPVNATIEFNPDQKKFVVKPEEAGTKLSAEAVCASTAEAIGRLDNKLALGEDELIKPTVYSTDQKLIDAAELASGMVSAHLRLVMGGQEVGTIDGSMLSEFVTINDQFEVTFREEDLNNWINDMAAGFSTVGDDRTYTREDGKVITVSGGVYGWEVDAEALKNSILDAVRAGTVGDLEVPCSETAVVYNGPNERDWGARYIDVDISEQYVRFYGDDGGIIWEAPCISGMPDGEHDTGMGVWRVNAKESPSKLIGYENGRKIYETTVTYWMPFEGNGIGFHDATWQPSFGGSMYANGYGSHGCVNLSYGDAQSLYGIIDYGDVVVVHG